MEKRHNKRKPGIFKAEIISGGKSYSGVIKNLSEGGAFVEIVPTEIVKDFIPGTKLEVKFQLPSGEILNLHYEVRWLYSKILPSPGLKQNSFGLEMTGSSRILNDFLNTI